MEALHNEAPLQGNGEAMGTAWELYEEEGRIKFSFDGIPAEEVRKKLKSNGFKWSRYSKAWVRKLTPNAVFVTKKTHYFIRLKPNEMPLSLEALVSFVISLNAVVALKDVEPKARPQAVVKLAIRRTVGPLTRYLIVLLCIDVNLWLRG